MQKAKVTAVGARQCGLRAIKTASSICIRSTKPPVQGQQYLDLYVLQRDRARWEQLKERAEEMIRGIDKAMSRLGLGPHCLGGVTTKGKRETRRPAIVLRSQSRRRG